MIDPPCRILIADDRDIVCKGVHGIIARRPNWQVVSSALDDHEVLAEARRTAPDVLIVDHSLRPLGGLELLAALKRETPRTQVLIYTGHEHQEAALGALRAGARACVSKADSDAHLIAAIHALSIGQPWFSGAVSQLLLDHLLSTAPARPQVLTPRERQVLQQIVEGKLNKEISHALDIGIKTVETHRAALMQKLKVRTTAELVRYAVRNHIIEP